MSNQLSIHKEWLTSDSLKTQVAQALPSHIKPDRFMRSLFTQVQKNPKLMQCTKESLFAAIIGCGQLGIEPDGRRAHLIPYGANCTLIIDYKGLVELVMRSGAVKRIHADIVCDSDEFETDKGRIVAHKVNYRGHRGEPYAVYALAELADGSEKAEVLTRDEVEAIRKKSKGANGSPWQEHWGEMAKKTAFKRLAKWLPLDTEIHNAIDIDNEQSGYDRKPLIIAEPATVEETSPTAQIEEPKV
jgi:recombination protein RecT